MKKIILTVIIFFIAITKINAINLDVYSENILLYNLTDEEVVYSKNSDVKTPIASLTKIMTALVVIEYIDDLDDKTIISSNDLKGLIEQNASVAGFKIGEKVTYRDLLYGLLLPSGADAALALVHNTYKEESKFLEKMNEIAKKLNLKNTNFTTTTGLDTKDNYSTLTDLVSLLKYAIKNKDFYQIFTDYNYTTSNGRLNFINSFKKTQQHFNLELDYVVGAKTGTTDDAGLCLITFSKKDNKEFILVSTKAPMSYSKPYNLYDAELVYKYFFDNYDFKPVFNEGDIMVNLEVKDSLTKTLDVPSLTKTELYLDKNITKDDLEYHYNTIEQLKYNTKKGTKIGTLDIIYNGEILKTVDVFLNQKLHYNYFKILFLIFMLLFPFFIIKSKKSKTKKGIRMK